MNYNHYRNMALQDFKHYNSLKASLDILPRQIALLRNTGIYSAATGERVMHSVSTDEAVVAQISRIEHLQQTLENNRARIACIDAALNAVGKKDREMLFSFYINRQRRSVTKLCEETFSDRSWLYRKAQKALDKYITAFFGISKETCKYTE